LQALVLWCLALPLERRVLRALDVAVVLSDKDRDLVRRRGRAGRELVVAPPLDDRDMPAQAPTAQRTPPDVLFVGAMRRPENIDAALWLIEDIWPRVRAEVPGARLTIAGAEPTPAVRRAASAAPDVELTGYVDTLAPYYQRATVAVAPLRLGAGVKLKSAVAMLWGLPVVATSVAAEGVADPNLFFAVEDDAEGLARALVSALREPSAAVDVRDRAFEWSHGRYSSTTYARSLEEIYA
jgi:glycosyltransferase involved in cell wall biosynthesis